MLVNDVCLFCIEESFFISSYHIISFHLLWFLRLWSFPLGVVSFPDMGFQDVAAFRHVLLTMDWSLEQLEFSVILD